MSDRSCEYCGNPLPEDARSDQRFCDRTCKGSARRQRRRRERAKRVLSNFPGLSAPPSQSSGLREADARFRAMLVADEASRTPQTQEREWAAWERRHGTAHPDRVRARLARGTQARLDDWHQGTVAFVRPAGSIAEAGRRARGQQIRVRIADDGNPWNDPELNDVPAMLDGPYRSRR